MQIKYLYTSSILIILACIYFGCNMNPNEPKEFDYKKVGFVFREKKYFLGETYDNLMKKIGSNTERIDEPNSSCNYFKIMERLQEKGFNRFYIYNNRIIAFVGKLNLDTADYSAQEGFLIGEKSISMLRDTSFTFQSSDYKEEYEITFKNEITPFVIYKMSYAFSDSLMKRCDTKYESDFGWKMRP